MIKETAVEWLESKFNEFETIYDSLPSGLYEYVNQAKEIEKQQEISYSKEEVDLLNKMFNLYWHENNNEHEDNLEEWNLSKKLFEQFKKK